MISAYLMYGFSEGKWHGKHFRRTLRSAGYSVVDNIQQAQIVIVHSGGPYILPPHITPEALVLINPVYWPGKSWLHAFRQKVWRDMLFHLHQRRLVSFLQKSIMNFFYLFRLTHSLTMLRNYNTKHFPDILPACPIIVIRNRHDPWCTPRISDSIPAITAFHELPGEHDDCWHNPEPYVALLPR